MTRLNCVFELKIWLEPALGGRHHGPRQPRVEEVDDGGGEADRPFFLLFGTAVQWCVKKLTILWSAGFGSDSVSVGPITILG